MLGHLVAAVTSDDERHVWADGQDHPSGVGELVEELLGEVGCLCGDEDPVPGSLLRQSENALRRRPYLRLDSRGAEVGGRPFGELRDELDADDVAGRPGEMGKECGRPSRSRSDVEDAVAGAVLV